MTDFRHARVSRISSGMFAPRRVGMALALAGAALLAGCASEPMYQTRLPPPSTSASTTVYYGIVDSIKVENNAPRGPGAGAIVGGVVGGLIGNQVGGGIGRAAATVAGAAGGAIVGNQIEHRNDAPAGGYYQITVRINDGSYQEFNTSDIGTLRPGTRVRIQNGVLYPY